MKKQVLTMGILAMLATSAVTFIGCGDNKPTEDADYTEHMDHDGHMHYQCPMKCEGDEIYDEADPCPKCGMDMKEIE